MKNRLVISIISLLLLIMSSALNLITSLNSGESWPNKSSIVPLLLMAMIFFITVVPAFKKGNDTQ